MPLSAGQTRREVVAYLIAAYNQGDATSLSKFGPADEERGIIKAVEDISDIPEVERLENIGDRLQSLIACEEFGGLAEIHPAWLVEVLSKESPRIIGIILRYLPSKQVRYIIENLPKRIKHRLPQLIDSFTVPNQILKIIRERFERQFVTLKGQKDFDEFAFENISYLKSSDLEVLFRDIGIHELAMALKGVDRGSLHILFNRLSIDEARALQQRIRSLVDVPASLLKEAKYTVLEMSLSESNPGDLLMDIGLNALAKALMPSDAKVFPLIKQKLEPRLGYTLKRYIEQHVDSNPAFITEKRKGVILSRVEALSRAGSIDENLVRYFVTGDGSKEIALPPSDELKEGARLETSEGWNHKEGVV